METAGPRVVLRRVSVCPIASAEMQRNRQHSAGVGPSVKLMTTLKLSNRPPDRQAATILVVEDDPILRFTLSMELSQAGFGVREAASAEEAETVLDAGAPVDLLVTDIEMPGTRDGLTLAKWVRAFRPHIRVIVVSGIVPETGIVGVADAFFGKPYDIDRVILRIRSLLKTRRSASRG
jgi:DNA-binding NtrC family response regulator